MIHSEDIVCEASDTTPQQKEPEGKPDIGRVSFDLTRGSLVESLTGSEGSEGEGMYDFEPYSFDRSVLQLVDDINPKVCTPPLRGDWRPVHSE